MADSDQEEEQEDPRPRPSPPSSPHPDPSSLHPSSSTPDLSEETQDFRFLSSLTSLPTTTTTHTRAPPPSSSSSTTKTYTSLNSTSTSNITIIPRRGEKDFEPNPTQSQRNALQESRQAMHDALAVERVHGAKNWVVGYFTGRRNVSEGMGGGAGKAMDKGKRFAKCVVRVDHARGPLFGTMGVADGRNRMWLLPEEALYLLERGSLDVRWGGVLEESHDEEGGKGEAATGDNNNNRNGDLEEQKEDEDEEDPSLSDLPMSLQGAYATFISDEDLTLARYTVFAGLKRSGYTVVRAPTWNESPSSPNEQQEDTVESRPTISEKEIVHSPATVQQSLFSWSSIQNFMARIFNSLFRSLLHKPSSGHPNSCPSLGPLVAPGLYRSYADIYRALTLIPFHDPLSRPPRVLPSNKMTLPSQTQLSPTPSTPPTPTLRISYHVYKSTTPYRKTSPPTPDFHLAVIDARSHPTIPNLTELGTLLEEMPFHNPREEERLKKGRPEMRLKTGTRSVVLAVVDNGVVSFVRVAETGSGRERIYEGRGARGGGKRGGYRGRGRGMGRGRGR